MYTRVRAASLLNTAKVAACAKASKRGLTASLGVTYSPAGSEVAIALDVSRVAEMLWQQASSSEHQARRHPRTPNGQRSC